VLRVGQDLWVFLDSSSFHRCPLTNKHMNKMKYWKKTNEIILSTGNWVELKIMSMTIVAADSTTVTRMPSAPIQSRDTAVPASRATWETEPSAESGAIPHRNGALYFCLTEQNGTCEERSNSGINSVWSINHLSMTYCCLPAAGNTENCRQVGSFGKTLKTLGIHSGELWEPQDQ
ncbi:hypothetical protein STEG23_020157, partial [Scotinomys teguina]